MNHRGKAAMTVCVSGRVEMRAYSCFIVRTRASAMPFDRGLSMGAVRGDKTTPRAKIRPHAR